MGRDNRLVVGGDFNAGVGGTALDRGYVGDTEIYSCLHIL